jgi:glycosyltransferase involved in cell wall biosynthesis
VYAQCPVSARAALAARSGPQQRVVLAVHFRISQSDEWADKGQIARGGRVYRWIRRTEREVVPAVDGVVFVSAWAAAAVRSWMPEMDRASSTVIGNFVQDPGSPSTARAATTGTGASATAVPPVSGDLVSVGNLEAVKNHRYLLRILAAARRAGHAYTLDVFGEGVERARLLALAEELGVGGQVRLRGFCSDVQDRLPGYRAYVHASYSESSSLAIMEAMAVGLPVLSGDAGALVELFEDPTEGRFWPLDDPEAAARALVDLMEAPAELDRAGRAARRRFLRDYDADTVAPRLLSFLTAARAEGRGSLTDR